MIDTRECSRTLTAEVLDVSYLGARPENCPFPYSSDVDYEGDPYGDNMTYEDFVQLNREMNPNAHLVHAEDDIP
jgi:serine/threonine-protein kinase RIO1